MRISKSDVLSIEKTVEALKNGDVVIIPTDTVYGFSGIVCKDFATDVKIKNIKGRDENKPFIQLIASPKDISNYTDDIIPQKLFDCWPGALTIIVNDKNGGTTAFRCPGDQWLREIIEKEGLSVNIQVDGGIDKNTIKTAADAGADIFVAGSALFKQEDYIKAVEELRAAAE